MRRAPRTFSDLPEIVDFSRGSYPPKGGSEGRALEDAVAKLVTAGIVFPIERGPEGSFGFKHALVRDAAYESLLLGRRREWHVRIARALEEHFPDIVANEPELLAYHFGEAGLASTASDYRMRAGDRAVTRSAYKEAASHYKAGMEATKALQPEEGRTQQLRFLLKLGTALAITQGAQGTETEFGLSASKRSCRSDWRHAG